MKDPHLFSFQQVHGEHLPTGFGNEALQLAEALGSAEQVIANLQLQSSSDSDDSGRAPGGLFLLCHMICSFKGMIRSPLSKHFAYLFAFPRSGTFIVSSHVR